MRSGIDAERMGASFGMGFLGTRGWARAGIGAKRCQ